MCMESSEEPPEIAIDRARYVFENAHSFDDYERLSQEYNQILIYIADLHAERLANATDIATYDLPELPELAAKEIYDRIRDAEAKLASPTLDRQGYKTGAAEHKDQIGVYGGSIPILLTSEHATWHYRRDEEHGRRKRKGPDRGTAGLGYVLHQDTGAHFMTMLGHQTRDANHDEEHPFKDEMAKQIIKHRMLAVVAIHGMKSGKFVEFTDEKALDVLVGIGLEPNEASEDLGRRIRDAAEELGLKAAVNEWFVKIAEDEPLRPERHEDGYIAYHTISALPHYTTRAFAQKIAEENDIPTATVQIELSDLLRLQPREIKRDRASRQLGIYLGYLLIRRPLEEWWRDNQLRGISNR
jgi:hypothetical protein